MSYIAHSLELDCGILIEVCSNPSNQFGTHHSEKELHIPQLPSFLSCFPAPASPWIYSVFTNLPVPDLFYNCMNNMWSSGNAFLFSVHVSFKTQPHSHLSATDTHEGTVWMFHKDLHSMRLLYAFVPSLDRCTTPWCTQYFWECHTPVAISLFYPAASQTHVYKVVSCFPTVPQTHVYKIASRFFLSTHNIPHDLLILANNKMICLK